MKSRWVMAFLVATAVFAPRPSLASDASYDQKALRIGQEREEQAGAGSGEAMSGPGMQGMSCGTMGEMGCCGGTVSSRVTVEDTPDGAVLRLKAANPRDAARVQAMAHMMESCMEEGGR
jgi:hypothetical protein